MESPKYLLTRCWILKVQVRLNGKLQGFKFGAWEGGHRVPFIVRWPGKVPAATESPALISQIDLIVTFATVANVSIPKEAVIDGVNQQQRHHE